MKTKRKQYPSQARLRELFDYDPEGFLVWRYRPEMSKSWNTRWGGRMPGTRYMESMSFRHRVTIGGRVFKYIDLLWIYFYGEIPDGKYVKTKAGPFSLSRPEELKISGAQNAKSVGNYLTTNIHGMKGVRKQKGGGGYQAVLDGKGLGTFSTPDAAASAWLHHAKKKYGDGVVGHHREIVDFEKFRITQNQQQQKQRKSGHKFRGVMPNRKSWMARIGIDGKPKYLGTYETQEQAARAYNIAAYEHYGEHAALNDIPDPLGKLQADEEDVF